MNITKFQLGRSFLALIMSSLVFSPLAAAADSSTAVEVHKENPGSLPVLVSLEHVSKDLHLTSLQRSVIAGLRSDYRAAAIKISKAGCVASSDTAQLQLQLDHLSATYNERVLTLLNPRQRRRLREIERQILGGTLLTSPSEQQFLGLTEPQKKKIELLAQDDRKKAAAINLKAHQGKLNYHRQVMALRKNRLQHANAMVTVLTPEQLETWKKAQGAKVAF
jgi:Spy/CpxP family protein refolding chaperone